ncbi:MAG: hypothetical protein ACO1PW_05610, partial [Actinomycetota bacterium]
MGELAEVVDLLEVLLMVLYGALALAALVRRRRLRDAATTWAAAVFAVLAGVLAADLLAAGDDADGSDGLDRVLLAGFFLLPYLLFRVTAALRRPPPRVHATAAAVTAAAVLPVFVLDIPTGDDTSTAFTVYTAVVLTYWIGLSALVASWMWRGGADRSRVVRARMRTLAVAVSLLAGATLLLGVGSSDDPGALDLVA